ncbi:hypothetical protein [Pelosinus sp. sgz500959]|uniref:hypothetical protein n=1 Tax=Pelosinus sp. sgz500959 TaxID=3242472 RepID=UPI00366E8FEA
MNNEDKLTLSAVDLAMLEQLHTDVVDDFLHPDNLFANVVGLGIGVKWKNNQPTGRPALMALVTQKVASHKLSKVNLLPSSLYGIDMDVIPVGRLMAKTSSSQFSAGSSNLTERIRPAQGGYSIGHVRITAGTMGTCVYDLLPKNIGIPKKYYILSNNHVLAEENNAYPGDPIIQPGRVDGGSSPFDTIATLSRFIPIDFEPFIPRYLHNNVVDAAIAQGQLHNLNRAIYWMGHLRGWLPKSKVNVGLLVQKTGRTTGFTRGRIVATNATVDVSYEGGKVARFKDQIVNTAMTAGGDSGSLLITLINHLPFAIGLHFASSPFMSIANQIENVRSLLKVEIAENSSDR